MSSSAFNSKIRIDLKHKVILARLSESFDEEEARNLTEYLDKIKKTNNIYNNIIIYPRKWRSTKEGRQILKNYKQRNHNIIVASSPVHRAFLKTEAVYEGLDVKTICSSKDEAMNKLNVLES